MKKVIFFLSLISIGFCSCEQKAPVETTVKADSSVNVATLVKELNSLQDSMSLILTQIHELDSSKLILQKDLLTKLSSARAANKKDFTAAEALIKNIGDYPGMEVLVKAQSLLGAYDADSDSLINISARILNRSKTKNEEATQLSASIDEKDVRSISLRFKYDELAKRYNIILEKNQEILMKADTAKYDKTVPLFQIENPS